LRKRGGNEMQLIMWRSWWGSCGSYVVGF
jgi:hypothetical protein